MRSAAQGFQSLKWLGAFSTRFLFCNGSPASYFSSIQLKATANSGFCFSYQPLVAESQLLFEQHLASRALSNGTNHSRKTPALDKDDISCRKRNTGSGHVVVLTSRSTGSDAAKTLR
jgi:hypothetical protein